MTTLETDPSLRADEVLVDVPVQAPVDPAGIAAALRPFGESLMLPGPAYTSADVLAWEQRHLFAGSWTCLGRTASLRDGANQRALMVGDLGVLLTFPEEGDRVRAFANVCRHRAHELLAVGETCGPARAGLPVPRLVVRADRLAARGAQDRAVPGQVRAGPGCASRGGLARLDIRQRHRHRTTVRRAHRRTGRAG